METAQPARIKPRLRGVSHEMACYVSALAGCYLVSQSRGPGSTQLALVGTTIYSLCLFFLFTASALYHRPMWNPEARARMRRLDHSAIYFMIAGTVTPLALLSLDSAERATMLGVIWIGAALGIVKSLLWVHAPKPLSALAYVLISASTVPFVPRMTAQLGSANMELLLLGGGLYVLGAVIYSLKKPDPVPTVFGYHEIFHALVIAAAACQYWVILKVVRAVAQGSGAV
jgi:hemolysin III